MLSRVAERLYWSARYLERVENIARLIGVYDELLFDLPRHFRISWYNLIEINGSVPLFSEKHTERNERNVVHFLLADKDNPGSLLASLNMVRENIRTTRDVLPEEMWEVVNELDLYARKQIHKGLNRSERHQYLNTIIEGCQKVIGLLAGTMCRDAGWNFIIMGRFLERADMNTRILDSAICLMMQAQPEEGVQLGQVVWSKVLKSQSAYLSYRRSTRSAINGAMAVSFLLNAAYFPRSQWFCLEQIKLSAHQLPRAEVLVNKLEHLLDNTRHVERSEELNMDFSQYLNQVQLDIIAINHLIGETWFHFKQGAAA